MRSLLDPGLVALQPGSVFPNDPGQLLRLLTLLQKRIEQAKEPLDDKRIGGIIRRRKR